MLSATAKTACTIGGVLALMALAPRVALAQNAPAIEVAPPAAPAQVVEVPGAAATPPIRFDSRPGTPVYRPSLPADTPAEQIERDPLQPVTTLTEALQRTYWTSPRVLSARATARSVDFRVPQARAGYGPQLEYSASYNYRRDSLEQAIGSPLVRSGWTSVASAVLTQPLFTFGRVRAGEDSARAQVAYERSILAATEQQQMLLTLDAYMGVLRDRASVGIAQSNVDLLAREFGNTQTRLQQRDATAADLQQVQTRLELARSQLSTARAQANASEARFLQVVGAPAGQLESPNPLPVPAQSVEAAYEVAQAANPVLAGAYARERVSRAQLRLAQADLLPRVDLRAQGSLGTVSPYSDNLRETEVLGGVTITGTLDAGLRQSRIGEAAAANDADWRLIDDALRQNREELAEAWSAWQSGQVSAARLQVAVQAAELALLSAQEQQRAGLRTVSEILDLARDLLQVRSSLNATLADTFLAQGRVLAAMGAMTHERLLPDAAHYEPATHTEKVQRQGDVPLLTDVVRALDSAFTPPASDRPIRDPAAPLATVPSPVPAAAN